MILSRSIISNGMEVPNLINNTNNKSSTKKTNANTKTSKT